MKNISIKKISIALVVLLFIISLSSICFASSTIIGAGDISASGGTASDQIQDVSGAILGVAQVIGVAVAVIMLVVLAIKYISAAPSEKADIKKSAFVYIIGALLLFGGVALLNIIQNAAEDIEDQTYYAVVEYK